MRAWRKASGRAAPSRGRRRGRRGAAAWLARGESTCVTVYGPLYERLRVNIRGLHPGARRLDDREGYGRVLGRPGLDLKRRELCVAAVCAATEQDRQLHSHLHGALHAGASAGEIEGALAVGGRGTERGQQRAHRASLVARAGGELMAFIDRARVHVEAGTGGSGCSSFRREHRVPMGGPDGGDGGRGGDVIVRGDSNLSTLLDYTYRDRWVAERGEHGSGNNKTGASGADVVLPMPPGTVIRDAKSANCSARSSATATRSWSPRADAAGRGTPSSPPRRINRRANGSRAKKGRSGTSSSNSSSSPTWGSSVAERGEVHAALGDLRGAPQDRRLPVHDAVAEPRRRAAERPSHVRGRRHSRHHRRRARREGTRPAIPAAHRAHAHPGVPDPGGRAWIGRWSTTRCGSEIASYSAGARGEAALRGVHENGPDRRARSAAASTRLTRFGIYAISSAARQGLDTLLDAWWTTLLSLRKAATFAAKAEDAARP